MRSQLRLQIEPQPAQHPQKTGLSSTQEVFTTAKNGKGLDRLTSNMQPTGEKKDISMSEGDLTESGGCSSSQNTTSDNSRDHLIIPRPTKRKAPTKTQQKKEPSEDIPCYRDMSDEDLRQVLSKRRKIYDVYYKHSHKDISGTDRIQWLNSLNAFCQALVVTELPEQELLKPMAWRLDADKKVRSFGNHYLSFC